MRLHFWEKFWSCSTEIQCFSPVRQKHVKWLFIHKFLKICCSTNKPRFSEHIQKMQTFFSLGSYISTHLFLQLHQQATPLRSFVSTPHTHNSFATGVSRWHLTFHDHTCIKQTFCNTASPSEHSCTLRWVSPDIIQQINQCSPWVSTIHGGGDSFLWVCKCVLR